VGGKQQFAGISWNDCSVNYPIDYKGNVTQVIPSPEPPNESDYNSIEAIGFATEVFDGGEFELQMFLGGIKIVDQTGDACSATTIILPHNFGHIDYPGFNCPIQADQEVMIAMHITLYKPIPFGFPITSTIYITSQPLNFWCLHLNMII